MISGGMFLSKFLFSFGSGLPEKSTGGPESTALDDCLQTQLIGNTAGKRDISPEFLVDHTNQFLLTERNERKVE